MFQKPILLTNSKNIYTTIKSLFFLKENNHFIQLGCIKLIESDSKVFPTMFFHLCNGHCEINLHWKGHIISGSKTRSYFIFRKKLLMEKPFMCLCGNVMRLSECSTLIYSQQLSERQPLTVIKYGIKIQSCREASRGIPRRDGPLSSWDIAFRRLTAFTAIRYRTCVKPRAVD